jgi:hypothetical protein
VKQGTIVKALYDNYVVTALLLVWGIALFTTITIKVFFNPVEIPTSTAMALATIYGLVPLVVGLLKWRIDRSALHSSEEVDTDVKTP